MRCLFINPSTCKKNWIGRAVTFLYLPPPPTLQSSFTSWAQTWDYEDQKENTELVRTSSLQSFWDPKFLVKAVFQIFSLGCPYKPQRAVRRNLLMTLLM